MLEGKAPRLELIVAGARNDVIAEWLAIRVGTVKSLAMDIVAKLGVMIGLTEDLGVLAGISSIMGSVGYKRNTFNTAEGRLTTFHEEINRRAAA
ncbi:MAG TPA: hypothetical protein VHX88_04590 [Solirubrobacteraceae bacterium]|jgi:hypothetical protein|nr:hypothetical protein [Solirubrobacteraceae bacterium]